MLHSRTLRYLDEVARAGSIRRAAERLNVSPTAVNQQILAYELDHGIRVFERLPRGMRLTTAGEALIGHIRRTLQDYRQTEIYIEQLRGLRAGSIRLGTMSGLTSGLLASILTAFHRDHPAVTVSVHTMSSAELTRMVIEDELDLCLGYNLPADPQLATVASFDGRLGAVMRADHPLAGASVLRVQDCIAYPLVMPLPGMAMATTIGTLFAHEDATARPVCTTNSIELMKNMLASGDFITFISRFDMLSVSGATSLVHIPLAGTMPQNTLSLIRHRRRKRDLSITLLADLLQDAIRTLAPGH
jgi:DNA-binding transcriptional LysR family regulator